jgi:antitoxin (DNA-binding transcriptional repressor) of toxin-antitoxin stability system
MPSQKEAHPVAFDGFGATVQQPRYNESMKKRVIRVSEAEAGRDFSGLLKRVRAGTEIIIEQGAHPIAIVRSAEPEQRTISQCIDLLPEDSSATVDADFAKDVAAAVASHRESLNPPAWD